MIDSEDLYRFAKKIYPYDRSITGEGVRKTLNSIKEILPRLKIQSVASGETAYDWLVPQEWKVRSAYIITPNGHKICDFTVNNLHIVGYSVSVDKKLSLHYIYY